MRRLGTDKLSGRSHGYVLDCIKFPQSAKDFLKNLSKIMSSRHIKLLPSVSVNHVLKDLQFHKLFEHFTHFVELLFAEFLKNFQYRVAMMKCFSSQKPQDRLEMRFAGTSFQRSNPNIEIIVRIPLYPSTHRRRPVSGPFAQKSEPFHETLFQIGHWSGAESSQERVSAFAGLPNQIGINEFQLTIHVALDLVESNHPVHVWGVGVLGY